MTTDLLFDTTPETAPEDAKKRPAKRKKAATAGEQTTAPACASYRVLPAMLGRLDGHCQCWDSACGAECLDILDEQDKMWLLECAFCGTRFWGKEVAGVLDHGGEKKAFRLRGGRFDGLTFAEVVQRPRGEEYVHWAAAEHPRPAVKEAAKTWLAENSAVR